MCCSLKKGVIRIIGIVMLVLLSVSIFNTNAYIKLNTSKQ